MALKLPPPPPLTIFSPQPHTPRPSSTELRFSRWNNANAEKFNEHRRSQQEIEDEIRRERRFEAATRITSNYQTATSTPTPSDFKSIGTPSSPSRPSIPGKKSKYSRTPRPQNPKYTHPAFSKSFKAPKIAVSKLPIDAPTGVQVSETGVSYKLPNAPFEFQYSYTETPKVKPLALREPPFDPFGPTTMPRPWTGRAPLPPSKKKLPEFDSFKLPPHNKKGVKPVQKPGPFLAGMGPKYVKSREEVLGEPLTEDEITELVQGCIKTRRQLNMGRDGLTHNMLDNIHAHWKRRRVCKIKCKGVCTVDMDNVKHQLEEKTGGKIIYSRGGVLFLFRGRNYNYKSRPRFPIMLWKPVTPIYPRLIQQAPEGLTLEQAKEMRKKGRELQPICKLGKNGVYTGLVKHVREAFEECELVRIDCQGMNGSDYKKIGGKLKDLVPCTLISFEYEHILMWRGPEWKSSLLKLNESPPDEDISNLPNISDSSSEEQKEASKLLADSSSGMVLESPNASMSSSDTVDANFNGNMNVFLSSSKAESPSGTTMISSVTNDCTVSDCTESDADQSVTLTIVPSVDKCASSLEIMQCPDEELGTTSAVPDNPAGLDSALDREKAQDDLQDSSGDLQNITKTHKSFMEGVLMLQKNAIESGSAIILDDASLDADVVYKRSVALAKGAPPGPIFRNSVRKVLVRTRVKKENNNLEEKEVTIVTAEAVKKKSSKDQKLKDFREVFPDTLPYGSLGVDELAKLLG